MKRVLSTGLAIVLLIGLGTLAVLARPGGGDLLAPAKAAPLGLAARAAPLDLAAPAAPQTGVKWTNIAMPLEVSGVTTADGVAAYINANTIPASAAGSITRVAKWSASGQGLIIRNVGDPFEQDWLVYTGDWLLVAADATSATEFTFAWVGNVPEPGYRSYGIVANGWTGIMLPLDTDTATVQMADDLAAAIDDTGHITRVARWDKEGQGLVIRNVGDPFEEDFAVHIGYPYLIYSTLAMNWP